MQNWINIGATSDIPDQECKIIEINNTMIAIFNLAGEFYAIEDLCPHQHLPLADGLVENGCITCPFHGARFSIKTGALQSPPACEDLKTFAVRVVDGRVEVLV